MSELKVYMVYTPREGVVEGLCKSCSIRIEEGAEIYLKSEADKVVEEKDKEIAKLKDKLQNVSELLKETRELLIELQKMHKRCADGAIKEIRHHKYKRCLDMAYKCVKLCQKSKDRYRWAEDENLEHYYNHKIEFFARWHNRWLELAEKFKGTK